jgi:hypothetical protein
MPNFSATSGGYYFIKNTLRIIGTAALISPHISKRKSSTLVVAEALYATP